MKISIFFLATDSLTLAHYIIQPNLPYILTINICFFSYYFLAEAIPKFLYNL
jgi:hypothetical protein